MTRSGSKGQSMSNNPNAGQQFIDAMSRTSPIVNAYQRQQGQAGRATRKMKGRAIFRAWAEDGGKTNAAVIKAIENQQENDLSLPKKLSTESYLLQWVYSNNYT